MMMQPVAAAIGDLGVASGRRVGMDVRVRAILDPFEGGYSVEGRPGGGLLVRSVRRFGSQRDAIEQVATLLEARGYRVQVRRDLSAIVRDG